MSDLGAARPPLSGPASAGQGLFEAKEKGNCSKCHETSHDNRHGLGLAGITKRYPEDWLKKWISDPKAVWDGGDETVERLKARFGHSGKEKTDMPKPELTEDEVGTVLEYLKTL